MANAGKRKGDLYERQIMSFLRDEGVTVYRQHDGGTGDTGDFIIGPFVVEAKAYNDTVRALREGIQEAEVAALRLGGHIPAALIKREGYNTGASYFVLTLRSLCALLSRVDGVER